MKACGTLLLLLCATLVLSPPVSADSSLVTGYLVEYFRQCEPGSFVDVGDTAGNPPEETLTYPQVNFENSPVWKKPNGGDDLPFNDEFAAKFTGKISLGGQGEGEYTFCLKSDDGSKLWVDGSEVVDDNGLHPMKKVCGTKSLSGSGTVSFKITFYEDRGDAGLIFSWKTPNDDTESVVPASVLSLPQGGAGVRAEFFRQCHTVNNLADLKLDRLQPFTAPTVAKEIPISFPTCCTNCAKQFWCPVAKEDNGASCQADPLHNKGTPNPPCMPFVDYYAARFSGYLSLVLTAGQASETCYFQLESDDGSVLYVNGTKVVDDDGVHGMDKKSGSVTITSTGLMPFRLEYFENQAPGGLILKMKGCGGDAYKADFKVIDYTKFKVNAVSDAQDPPDRLCTELKPMSADENNLATRKEAREKCIKEKKFIWCDQVPFPTVVGDGRCDEENNLEGCWDGGDCCRSTCVDGRYSCGVNSFDSCHAGFKKHLRCDVRSGIKFLSPGEEVESVTIPSIDWQWGPPQASTWKYLNASGKMTEFKHFALFIKGFMHISNGGEYTFCLSSDDGSVLYIDSMHKEFVNNAKNHGMKEICETKWMSAGFHPISLKYHQAGQYCGLTLDVEGPAYLDKEKFGKSRIRESWIWWADVCPTGFPTCSGHGKCVTEYTDRDYGVPYNHTCSCHEGYVASAGTCVDIPAGEKLLPQGNGWEIFTIILLSLMGIGVIVCAWKREMIKRYLLSTLASARFYQHVEPLNGGKDDRITTEL
eukprot:g5913.t1